MSEQSEDSRYRYILSLWLPAAVLGALLVLVLVVQVVLSWKAHSQLAPVGRHLAQMTRLQNTNLALQRELVESLREEGVLTAEERERMRAELAAILGMQAHLSSETPKALAGAHAALADASIHPRDALIVVLSYLRSVLDQETMAHQKLVEEVSRATVLELEIGTITLLVFPSSALLLIYFLRRRILAPIKHLSFLMTLLGRKKSAPAPVAAIDPMLRPLTENYNAMLTRLAELEQEHALREQDLEGQVESATRALLEQQRTLANAERLAAVGEMMARIAHELRNPLAGVKLACTNLRQELSQALESREYTERIDIVVGEIDRIIALLNALLDQSRHRPEPSRALTIARAVEDLVVLARYQIPARIRIQQRIPDDIVCCLPEALFRQALLNLLLNACQAIGEQAGSIEIEAGMADGRLCLRIRDDGPGFPQDLLTAGIRLFVTHRAEGTGLGLSMVQRFARAHGGGIQLANLEPHGACVTLDLPCGDDRHA